MSQTLEFLVEKNKGDDLKIVINYILESELLNIEHLINHPNIQESKSKLNKEYNTLMLFSRGEYLEYKADNSKFIELKEKSINKLKRLTIVKIASKNKVLNFSNLISILDLNSQFELDQILFELNISQWVVGKIDHVNQVFKISEIKARDYIEKWCDVENKIRKWLEKVDKADRILQSQKDDIKNYSLQCECNIQKKCLEKVVNN